MNSSLILCFLLGCVVIGQARYVSRKRPVHPIKQELCHDYVGRPVYPGSRYFDGCNTCTCGSYRQPTICTRKYCGPAKPIFPVKPVYPVKPISPVKPVYPVEPVYPIKPIHPVKPVYPVIGPIKPRYPAKRFRGGYSKRERDD